MRSDLIVTEFNETKKRIVLYDGNTNEMLVGWIDEIEHIPIPDAARRAAAKRAARQVTIDDAIEEGETNVVEPPAEQVNYDIPAVLRNPNTAATSGYLKSEDFTPTTSEKWGVR